MGGEGSGRHANPIKKLLGFNQPAPTDNAMVYLPNYSGIKDSVKKITGWTTGSVVFVGATGDFTQDNSNFFWDDTNNRLGIGTTSPDLPLTVVANSSGDAVRFWGRNNGTVDECYVYWRDNSGTSPHGAISGESGTLSLWGGSTRTLNLSGGNVGIGTTSPNEKLQIASGDIRLTYLNGIKSIYNGQTDATAGVYILGTKASDITFLRAVNNNAANGVSIDQYDGTSIAYFKQGGNVGIGTTAPDGKLHVNTATAGTLTPDTSADDLIVENSTDSGITIAAPDASQSGIYFASPSDAIGARLIWVYNSSLMTLQTAKTGASLSFGTGNTVEAMRIDSSGNVGIGTTTPDSKLHISGGGIVSNLTTAPTLVYGSGAIFLSGGTTNTVELWLKGPTTQTRLGTVS